jgi:hypothetical protein
LADEITTGRVLPCTMTAGPAALASGAAAAINPAPAVVAMKSRRLILSAMVKFPPARA